MNERYDNLQWMKLSEIARYWAAKELTKIERLNGRLTLTAPYACPGFTVEFPSSAASPRVRTSAAESVILDEVADARQLKPGKFTRNGENLVACFDLPKGISEVIE